MKLIKQDQTLPIVNLDIFNEESTPQLKHGYLLPPSLRAIFCGPSGCGKTNALLSLIFNPNSLFFENVYIYSKSLCQPKYELLKNVLNNVKGVKYFPFQESDSIVDPSEAQNNSIIIFDDIVNDSQDKIRQYFSMGRHKGIDAIYLCQTYTKIPKQLIRDNCNLIVIFRQDDLNLKHIFDEHVTPDLSFDQFKNFCSECWKDKYGCLVIVKDFNVNGGRYRKCFDTYIIP